MTLREWLGGDMGKVLDGVVLEIPKARRQPGMGAEMAIRSAWAMEGGSVGIWFAHPGERSGRVFPVTDVRVEDELLEWTVVERR